MYNEFNKIKIASNIPLDLSDKFKVYFLNDEDMINNHIICRYSDYIIINEKKATKEMMFIAGEFINKLILITDSDSFDVFRINTYRDVTTVQKRLEEIL